MSAGALREKLFLLAVVVAWRELLRVRRASVFLKDAIIKFLNEHVAE
jgi:hypothetical protein